MLSHVLRTIRRNGLLVGTGGNRANASQANAAGEIASRSNLNRVLCAVSGGPDSMALLACLWELAPRLGLHLEVATVDHGLRPQAAAELALVAERAAALGIPWHPLQVDVRAARERTSPGGRGSARRGGVQEVARRLRLDALAALAEKRELGQVALGHTADDQTETVLFRVLRGTGLKGLAGIPYRRPPFIRPLLDVTRVQVLAYLHRRSIPFVSDPSNADLRYARARLRHRILPLLRQENPQVDQALRALAHVAGTSAALARFQTLPAFVEMLRDGVHIPTRLAAQVAAAVRDGRGTQTFHLAGGRRVTVAYGEPVVSRGPAPPTDGRPDPIVLDGPGIYPFGVGTAIAVCEKGPADSYDEAGWVWFDGEHVAWPLYARVARAGDRMKPRAGAGSRKLADLLIDAKIPRGERAGLPVVTMTAGEILFVPGLRPAHLAVPGLATVRRIGLAVVTKADHDGSQWNSPRTSQGALVDPSIVRGNTGNTGLMVGLNERKARAPGT